MGPISAINDGLPRQPSSAAAVEAPGADAVATDSAAGGVQVALTTQVSTSVAITHVQAAVSQMLQSIDGDLAANKTLRMLIGLLILLTLLQNSTSQEESADKALNDLGRGGEALFAQALASSTTLEIQQSVSTKVVATASGTSDLSTSEPQPPGSQIDVSA
jgi:hypothetical protein